MQTGKYKAVVLTWTALRSTSHYNIDALQMTCIELLDGKRPTRSSRSPTA